MTKKRRLNVTERRMIGIAIRISFRTPDKDVNVLEPVKLRARNAEIGGRISDRNRICFQLLPGAIAIK